MWGEENASEERGECGRRHVVKIFLSQGRLQRSSMCRNIKTLFNFDPPVTDDEVRAASLQFVRKICGFTKPSNANEDAFLAAVEEVAEVSMKLDRKSTRLNS